MTRPIDLSVEVLGTPEEVWEAIATGPGISVWFVPTEVEERLGGRVTMHHGEGMYVQTGDVTAWEQLRESSERGWQMCLRVLELYLTHFAGQPGARIQTLGSGDRIAVEHADDTMLTLRLEEPAPGVGIVVVGPADVVYTQLSASLFGESARAVAEREQPVWEAWMRERFSAKAE